MGAGVNAYRNHGKLKGWDYAKSIVVGAASGFVAAYTGPLGAGTAAALNEIHEQTLEGNDITNYDSSQIVTAGLVGWSMGHVGQTLQGLGKGVGWFGGNSIGNSPAVSNFETTGSIFGVAASVYADVTYSTTIDNIMNDFDQFCRDSTKEIDAMERSLFGENLNGSGGSSDNRGGGSDYNGAGTRGVGGIGGTGRERGNGGHR